MPWPLMTAPDRCTCKVCAAEAIPFGVRDINLGGPPGARPRPLLNQDVTYFRCPRCGLIFTNQLDHWTSSQFAQHIYNESYVQVDPDYVSDRPRANAQMLLSLLPSLPSVPRTQPRLLDFGAGSGLLAQLLIPHGIDADSHDPYGLAPTLDFNRVAKHSYDVVCAFEVLEHSANPLDTLTQIGNQLKPGGWAIVSTLLQPDDMAQMGCDWWYCAPRNGHITLFSAAALGYALQLTGFHSAHSLSPGLHLACYR